MHQCNGLTEKKDKKITLETRKKFFSDITDKQRECKSTLINQ